MPVASDEIRGRFLLSDQLINVRYWRWYLEVTASEGCCGKERPRVRKKVGRGDNATVISTTTTITLFVHYNNASSRIEFLISFESCE